MGPLWNKVLITGPPLLIFAVGMSIIVWELNRRRRTALKTGIFKLGRHWETDRAKHPWEFRAFMLWWWICVPLGALMGLVAWIALFHLCYEVFTRLQQ
jgi:hypothetical protein